MRTLATILALLFFGSPVAAQPTPAPELATLQRNATAGNPEAQFQLGDRYATGRGVQRDPSTAATWFQRAAERGHLEAQVRLGLLYRLGEGVPQDFGQALRWYRMATEGGSRSAQVLLGGMYARGLGVPVNVAEARRLLEPIAAQNTTEGRDARDELRRLGVPVASPTAPRPPTQAPPGTPRSGIFTGRCALGSEDYMLITYPGTHRARLLRRITPSALRFQQRTQSERFTGDFRDGFFRLDPGTRIEHFCGSRHSIHVLAFNWVYHHGPERRLSLNNTWRGYPPLLPGSLTLVELSGRPPETTEPTSPPR